MDWHSWQVLKLLIWVILQLLVLGVWVQDWMFFYKGVNVEKVTDRDGNVITYKETYSGRQPNWKNYVFWDAVLLLVIMIFM